MDDPSPPDDLPTALPDLVALARDRTPARLLVGRAGSSYLTETQLTLWEDHAAAVDAVRAEFDARRDLGVGFVDRWGLLEVRSRAGDKAEYLLRPDLGRRLDPDGAGVVGRSCPGGADLQVVV